jgi:hypothetical protein
MRSDRLRITALTLMGLLCLVVGAEKPVPEPVKKPKVTARLGDLHAEVAALQAINALQPTEAQTKALLEVAAKTMQKAPPRRKVEVSEDYLKALTAVRAALISGDQTKIESAQVALDKLGEAEDPEPDNVEITDEARRFAPKLLKRFSARQIAFYVGGLRDFPDPAEDTIRAMDEARMIDKKEWPALRDDVAFQVGWLVAGLDADAEEKVRDKVVALLDRAARLDKAAFEKQRHALEKEARALAGDLGPTDIVRHFMERVIAETISNHRFEAAMKMREVP